MERKGEKIAIITEMQYHRIQSKGKRIEETKKLTYLIIVSFIFI